MSKTKQLTLDEVIRQLGNAIVEVDVLRANFNREEPDRKKLDNIRDDLDVAQRKLVRGRLAVATEEFQSRAASLQAENKKVLKSIEELEEVAKTLEALVMLVDAAQKLADIFS